MQWAGLIEDIEYTSSSESGEIKHFLRLTERGLAYGVNLAHPVSKANRSSHLSLPDPGHPAPMPRRPRALHRNERPIRRLLQIGFEQVGSWHLRSQELALELTRMNEQRNVLYAFVQDASVLYVGKTTTTPSAAHA